MSESNATLTRKEMSGLISASGIALLVWSKWFDGPSSMWIVAAALLLLAAVIGLAEGQKDRGKTTHAASNTAAADRDGESLAGSKVVVGRYADVFTILDETADLVPAKGGATRTQVRAADELGRVGGLFLGMDSDGCVIAASIDGEEWEAARLVS